AVRDLWPQIMAAVAPEEQRQYVAGREQNLKAIYTAMMLYHESEGQFPADNGWMDAIKNRIRVAGMSAEEAGKKLIRPDMESPAPGAYGYSMNEAASAKYKGDLKDPNTVLIYESADTAKNAHGDPKKEKSRMAVTIQGKIVKL
ncbi:MAG TPA: hypothetical protein VG944_24300, partial [Fimbriimonas sp.]|nr:hypothetical protein [Fimbriimonas sp.]